MLRLLVLVGLVAGVFAAVAPPLRKLSLRQLLSKSNWNLKIFLSFDIMKLLEFLGKKEKLIRLPDPTLGHFHQLGNAGPFLQWKLFSSFTFRCCYLFDLVSFPNLIGSRKPTQIATFHRQGEGGRILIIFNLLNSIEFIHFIWFNWSRWAPVRVGGSTGSGRDRK